MVALIAALSPFHISQQVIHFDYRQITVGAHRAMARDGGEQFIDSHVEPITMRKCDEIGKHVSHQRLDIDAIEHAGRLPHG
jgi:hypothetical protein